MIKKRFIIALCLLIIFANGCWDRRELETLGLVLALGLDKGPGGKGITVTTMLANPPKFAGGSTGGSGSGEGSGSFVITMSAPTIYEAFNRINTVINREITLMQELTLLIGEGLAKEGIQKWMDTLIRYREMRRTTLVFVCHGDAAKYMNIQPKLEKNPSEYYSDLVGLSKINGFFPVVTINDFMMRYEAPTQEMYAPLVAEYKPQTPESPSKKEEKGGAAGGGSGGGEKSGSSSSGGGGGSQGGGGEPGQETSNVRLVGTAIFKNDKLVGSFDNYESQALLLLTGQFREAMLSIPDLYHKDDLIAFRLLQASPPAVKYYRKGTQDYFLVKLKLEADLASIQSGVNYTEPDLEDRLAGHIARTLENRLMKVIRKAQQYQTDVFGFGIKARNTFWLTSKWDQYHWPERFPQANFKTQVKVNFRRVGIQLEPPKPR